MIGNHENLWEFVKRLTQIITALVAFVTLMLILSVLNTVRDNQHTQRELLIDGIACAVTVPNPANTSALRQCIADLQRQGTP